MDTKGIDLTKCHNCRFRAVVDGKEKTGRVQVIDGCIKFWFDYHDELNDTICHTLHIGYYREYGIGDFFNDFEIVPRDPETYKDWQVGDKANRGMYHEVIFRSGELVIFKDWNNWASCPMTCSEAFTRFGFRLVLTDIEQKIIEERKKAEWTPQDGEIIAFGYKAIGIFRNFEQSGLHSDYVTLSVDNLSFNKDGWIFDKLRPATEEEKQRLFDAMAKEGWRWNAERKCIESIPPETEEKSLRYGGDIADFPPEIVEKMLEYQEKQGNKRNVKVFERSRGCGKRDGGFIWDDTNEGEQFWYDVIANKNFDIFFKRYPKDNPEPRPDILGISQDTEDELDACIERLRDRLYESMRDQIYELTKDPCGFCGFYPSPGKIKTRSRKPIPKGGLYRKKKGFRPFGKVDKVKPVETRLHTKSK